MASSIIKKYLVGGAVRDMLMGVDSNDNDYVVVGSTPEEMLSLGFKQVGADFPVFLDENGIEYALARTERKNGRGYNGFVTDFAPDISLRDDLLRRDLTINAMAMNEDHTIIDPFNGRDDIRLKKLRHVSDAFADDPVRVLRLARFHARLGPEWTIAESTQSLCWKLAREGELDFLTRERVMKEMEKALSEPHSWLFFETLVNLGAMMHVFPRIRYHQNYKAVIGSAKSIKLKYARLAAVIDDVEQFENEYNVSVEWRRYRKMYQAALPEYMDPVDRLYAMDAYRQKDLVAELTRDFIKSGSMLHNLYDNAFTLTKGIGFDELSVEQQHSLKGPEIAYAIREKRKESI